MPNTEPKRRLPTGLETALLALALLAATAGSVFAFSMARQANDRAAAAREAAAAVKVAVVKITTPDCKDCVPLADLIDVFKKQPLLEVTGESELAFDSDEGKKLIGSLGIEKVPTFIARGDVKNKKLASFMEANGKISDDTFVFTNVPPVFMEPASGKTRGQLEATMMYDKRQCAECADPMPIIGQLQASGIKISNIRYVDPRSEEGESLVAKYALAAVPTIIVSGDTELFPAFKTAPVGTVEQDGAFVFRKIQPPFFDTAKNRVTGLVKLISLTDKSCPDCYDVGKHKNILTQTFGVKLVSEKIVDASSSEGRALVRQYSITALPTVLVSPDADAYADLMTAWKQAGSVEKNGWLVFRQMSALGQETYKDLATGTTIRPGDTSAAASSTGVTAAATDDMAGHHPE